MANKKADANPTPEATETPVAESEPEAIAADPVDQPAGDPPAPGDDAATDPVVESKPVTGKQAGGPADKKAADKARRQAAITEHQAAIADAPVDEKLAASDKKKTELLAKLDELAAEVATHDEAINALRDESSALLLELYPQSGENDPPSVAIRGYINASARERQHRKLAPARLKAILEKAGLAPIDAAFSRARGRGMARPARKVAKKEAPPAADQAKDATPIKKAE
jgi:hypothetical protein